MWNFNKQQLKINFKVQNILDKNFKNNYDKLNVSVYLI